MRKGLLALLHGLADAGGEFVIVGGVAAALHGSRRLTFDLDLVPSLGRSWPGMVEWIWRAGARPRIPETLEAIRSPDRVRRWIREKGMLALTFRTPDGSVEIDLLVAESSRFTALKRRATRVRHAGTMFHVASIRDLIAMKIAAGRPQDLLDVRTLRSLARRKGGR